MDLSFLLDKDFYTSAAIVAGAAYFVYKLLAGWLVINLSLEIKTARQHQNDDADLLIVTLCLEKGGIDAARLLQAQLRITPDPVSSKGNTVVPVSGIQRLECSKNTINWNKPLSAEYLNLAPNEKTHFSEIFRVRPEQDYKIEAIVIEDRYRIWRTLGQWRASAVSPPVVEKDEQKA